MLVPVIVFFVVLLKSSNQRHVIKNSVYSSDEGFYTYNVQLVPVTILNTEDNSSNVCFDWIDYIIADDKFKSQRKIISDGKEMNHSLIQNTKKCNSFVCEYSLMRKVKECPLDQINELIKLFNLGDFFWLLATGCSQKQYVGYFELEGDFVIEVTYEEISKTDYAAFIIFGNDRGHNVTDLHVHKLRSCTEECNNYLDDRNQHCYYNAPYDNAVDIYICIGVAAVFFIAYVLCSCFYYNSLM